MNINDPALLTEQPHAERAVRVPSTEASTPARSSFGVEPEHLIRPLLNALHAVTGLETTYLTVFDWEAREQVVRFAFGDPMIEEGTRIALPRDLAPESFPGVTRSPPTQAAAAPDSLIARGLGLETYLSVPVMLAPHRLYGMLSGASRDPRAVEESTISLFESFADTIAAQIARTRAAANEARAIFAERQLAERASFLAEAGHRLKTPLTILQGTAYLLHVQRDSLSEAKRSQLNDSLMRSIQWVTSEIEAMLSEARSEVLARELTCVAVQIGSLVHELTTAFDGLGTGHRVTAETPEEVVAIVDPVAMRQILGHLLDNAIKHGPPDGRIVVRVAEGEDTITVDVVDEGAGPPPEVDVFDPFQYAPEGDDRRSPIRLGLHIVRKLAEAMGASVDVLRRSDNTSTFRVTVPSARARTR